MNKGLLAVHLLYPYGTLLALFYSSYQSPQTIMQPCIKYFTIITATNARKIIVHSSCALFFLVIPIPTKRGRTLAIVFNRVVIQVVYFLTIGSARLDASFV